MIVQAPLPTDNQVFEKIDDYEPENEILEDEENIGISQVSQEGKVSKTSDI